MHKVVCHRPTAKLAMEKFRCYLLLRVVKSIREATTNLDIVAEGKNATNKLRNHCVMKCAILTYFRWCH